ncbi:rRNA-processing protein bfr2 [Sporothrix curviconia]|uniref:Protein BFR2 n=1 Tax=Sporothrix curviconia TaxID=1260050 RepID=A0ABP0BQR1_9PEZI
MVGLKGLAAQLFAKQSLAKEFDPESELPVDDDSDNQNGDAGSDSDVEAPENTQDTEHYVQVGKSKLRRNEPVALGPAYRGKRVSRKQLEEEEEEEEEEEDDDDDDEDDEDKEEEFDDPDEVDIEGAEEVHTDDEIDSDEAFGEDDDDIIKKFTFRGSGKPKTPKGKPVYSDGEENEEEEDEEESEGSEVEDLNSDASEEDDGEDDSENSEDDDDDDDEVDASAAKAEAETKKILAQERKQVLASISQSAKADADKGFAVRQQRRTFDALLNMRIRVQKALSTANTLHTVDKEGESAEEAIEEAAAKAIELLNAIQGIRNAFYDAGSSTPSSSKRKRTAALDASSSCQAIFDQMAETEEAALAKRRKVIDRWSARVQRPSASSAAAASRRFSAAAAPQALTTVLDGQLVTADRLVRRTRIPRSCAPVQAAKKVEEDPEIYDDADFYQLLLKELVDQRTVDGTASGSEAPTVRWATTAAKEAKTRKLVDRKASKGRKMRYNVHAKLQNFTAPEDRRDWEPEAIDRFFSSLFGQRMALQEDDGAEDDDDEDDESMGGASIGGDAGLRLF